MNRILQGDCTDVLRTLERGSISACVTDPPYHLTTNKPGGTGIASLNVNSPAGRSRIGTGFMNQAWDGGDIAFRPETWRLVFDAMKPGAHLVAFGGTRTYHRMACAIEDAGFEIRDTLCWLYGSGFPKSRDVSKWIDRAAGAEREVVGVSSITGARNHSSFNDGCQGNKRTFQNESPVVNSITAPATRAAIRWQGWGTALKPAFEPIILARKPLIGTVVANVLQHGTGAINIDASRVATEETIAAHRNTARNEIFGKFNEAYQPGDSGKFLNTSGRWPANVLHDGSEEVEAAFAAFGEKPTGNFTQRGNSANTEQPGGWVTGNRNPKAFTGDSGTASRFFKSCGYSDSELLICRAKAILEAWNYDLASTVDGATCLPSEAVASALSDVVILASQGTKQSSLARSMNATPVELKRISVTAIATILSIADVSSSELPQERHFPNGCLANCAVQIRQTDTTTITISHWRSDGSAEPATLNITSMSTVPGAADSRPNRFHYTAKADKGDRADSRHPTVKPVDLMRWLVRLVTPPGGTILDPFAGSGTTGEAAMLEGFGCIMIERDPQSVADIRHRIKRWSGEDTPLFAEVAAE